MTARDVIATALSDIHVDDGTVTAFNFDGRFTHLPRWHKADIWLTWQSSRRALPDGGVE